jgi:hypothetical protein
MAEAAVVEVREPAVVRRFEMPDLSKHGPWLIKRFLLKFPNFTEQAIFGYLSGLVYNNEHMFLYQDHAVALAQFVMSPGIKPSKTVQERFVWVEDRTDKEQLENAADFYSHMHLWGKRQDVERIIVCEDTDVPKAMIEARLGRLFDAKITHARM